MMCGAYTLALGGPLRADFVSIYLRPRGQAALGIALYLLFFLPGILGLIYAGYDYAAPSWRIGEHSTGTAEGPPVYHFTSVIPMAGALVMLQGLAEIARCLMGLRTGPWPARLGDAEEIDVIEMQLARSEYVDEESRVFALHAGRSLIEPWVLGTNLWPVGFLRIAQVIIFPPGWPLEWTEIIICPIFIPLLSHFKSEPILFRTMVAVNRQAAFLSPPVAMSAFYLKGMSPKHVTPNQISAGMMPYQIIIIIICRVFMDRWPGMTLWLPEFLHGR